MIAIARPAIGQTVIVPIGSTWRYLDDGTDQGTLWQEIGFEDGAWNAGSAQLGYGDGDEATVVSYGPDPNNKYITTYFRHTFDVNDPSQFAYILLRLLRDDGAVLHLNGFEINRSNMPPGSINYLTHASSAVSGEAENMRHEYYIDAGYLEYGANVIAVEIHQVAGTSSDISFDLELIGLREMPHPMRKAPYLIYTGDNTEMMIMWQLRCTDTCQVQFGYDTLYSFGSTYTYEYGDDHQHAYMITDLTPSTAYAYRIIAEEDTFPGTFRTGPLSDATEMGFFAYGDCRTYPADHDQVAASILASYTANPNLQSFVLSAGDLVSDGDIEDHWDSELFNVAYPNIQTMLANMPYQTCMGNHEKSGILFMKYLSYPFEDNRYWSFDYGPAHFVIVDQYVDYSPGSAQLNWIESDLACTAKPWKFICLHEPGWSAGGGHPNNTNVQNYIQPLCEDYGVFVLFAGHNHYYARAEVNGVQHITTGGGGANLYVPNLSYPNIVTATSAYHYCEIQIDDNLLSFTAISTSGDTLDTFMLDRTVTAVEPIAREVPLEEFRLHEAIPNPFNPTTTISFSILKTSHVVLDIFAVSGYHVRTLVDRELNAGHHRYTWDGRNDAGRNVSSGLYFYRLQSGAKMQCKKMLLLK